MKLNEIDYEIHELDRIIREAIEKRTLLEKERERITNCINCSGEIEDLFGRFYTLQNGKTLHLFHITGWHDNPLCVSASEVRFFESTGTYGKLNLTYGKSEPPVKVLSINDEKFIGPHGTYSNLPLNEISEAEYLKELEKIFDKFKKTIS